MDAMKEALKRMMKGGHKMVAPSADAPIDIDEEADEMDAEKEMDDDLAPELGEGDALEEKAEEAVSPGIHEKILAALSDRGVHGRQPSGLAEKVAMKVKEKFKK